MREPDFCVQISDFPLEKPVIITHCQMVWDSQTQSLMRQDTEHVYYEIKKGDSN